MADLLVYADAEGACRDWARDLALDGVGRRVWFGLPAKGAEYPAIVVRRVGGRPDASDTPLDTALVQWDVWGAGKDKRGCSAIALALAAQVQSMAAGSPMGTSAVGAGGRVESLVWLPDPVTNQARYVVTTSVTLRPI